MIRQLILCVVLLILDLYVAKAVRFLLRKRAVAFQRWIMTLYWGFSILIVGIIILTAFSDWHQWPRMLRTYSFALIFILFVSKLIVGFFLLMDDLVRLFRFAGPWLIPKAVSSTRARTITRSEFLVKTGMVLAAVPFTSLLWGMLYGAYRYTIHKVIIPVENLPDEFHRFRIVHISDIHAGSFHSAEPLQRAVELINRQSPDLICFTGDLVNDRCSELHPHLNALQRLRARHGIYSVLGNHDYGDYVRWPSQAMKADNLQQLIAMQQALGWKLLLDEHDYIERNGKKIGIAGVQNWSGRIRFQRYGRLQKAISGLNDTFFNILLTHDPSHWRKEVLSYPQLHLTLSGHTHGMQFGIELPGWKWSPARYFYSEWAGLYSQGNQKIYVNRGLGFIGYPGRVGILPEITVIELVAASHPLT
jgi:predicted MPP superfamily phosphohydrolase